MAEPTGQVQCYFKTEEGEFTHGVLGLFVFGSDGKLYAVTAKHVTDLARTQIYALNDSGEYEVLGCPCRFGADDDLIQDIALFCIEDNQRWRCNTVFTNIHGLVPRSLRVFDGTVDFLYSKTIIVCTSVLREDDIDVEAQNDINSDNELENAGSLFDVTDSIFDVQDDGLAHKLSFKEATVASKEIHDQHCELVNTGSSFLVVNGNEPLVPGDSGSVLFLQQDDGSVELVGVLGGRFHDRTVTVGPETEDGELAVEPCVTQTASLIQCALLHKGLSDIESRAGIKFQLTEFNSVERHRDSKKNKSFVKLQISNDVFPGVRIYVKLYRTPEQISKPCIDLLGWLHTLMWSFGEDNDVLKQLRQENDYEKELTNHVHARVDIKKAVLCWDSADQVCYYYCMLGCQAIYSCDFEKAEELLKDAIRAAIKCVCQNRFLGKVIQLVSLLWLRNDKPEKLKKLHEVSEKFMEAMDVREFESRRILGYFYMNFGWHFNRMGMTDFALELAWKCFDLFKDSSHARTQGQGLARVLLSRLMLQCGEFFDMIERPARPEAVENAENILKETVWDIKEIPVLRAHFLLAVSELRFRKADYRRALGAAQHCLCVAREYKLGDSERQARSHIDVLQKYVTDQTWCTFAAFLMLVVVLVMFLVFFPFSKTCI